MAGVVGAKNKLQGETILPLSESIQLKDADINNCSRRDTDICITKDCTLTAAMLISAMDTSFDPCDNFYDFACANFIRNHPVPDQQKKMASYHIFNQHFDLQLKNLVEGLGSSSGSNVLYRTQELYHVCINTTYQLDTEFLAFKHFTRHILDWPLGSGKDWKPKHETLSDYLALYEANGLRSMFAWFDVTSHETEPTFKIKLNYNVHDIYYKLHFNAISNNEFFKALSQLLGNKDEETIDEDLINIKTLSDTMESIVRRLYDEQHEGNMSEALQEVFLASKSNFKRSANLTFEMLHELTEQKIDWLSIVNGKLRNKHVFTEQDFVTISAPEKFRSVFTAINQLPLRTVLNIMGWKAMDSELLEMAGPDVQALLLPKKQNKTQHDRPSDNIEPTPKPRWKTCLAEVGSIFTLGVTRLFLEKYIDKTEKLQADEMIQEIQEAYIQMLRESEWLDEETKNSAIKKAEAIRRYVGYPDFLYDEEKLVRYYQDVLPEIRSTYFENYIEFRKYTSGLLRGVNRENVNEFEEWDLDPLMVNAFYEASKNSIWFPSGILQLPFFQNKRLAALNYGMIGSIIGHEIGHAFDNRGSTFDHRGVQNNWWTSETRKVFDERSKCFVEQYGSLCPEHFQGESETICINGNRTLGENLADYTGLNAAFVAYKSWVSKHGAEKRLPGLQEFSPEQLFFIGHGYIWCENVPADKWLDIYKYNSHSPGKYRILGGLSNNVFFRDAFHCPQGPMNRDTDSCTMW